MNNENDDHVSPNIEFWIKMFKPRTNKWKRDSLKRLKTKVSEFETIEDNRIKIKALEFLLNG